MKYCDSVILVNCQVPCVFCKPSFFVGVNDAINSSELSVSLKKTNGGGKGLWAFKSMISLKNRVQDNHQTSNTFSYLENHLKVRMFFLHLIWHCQYLWVFTGLHQFVSYPSRVLLKIDRLWVILLTTMLLFWNGRKNLDVIPPAVLLYYASGVQFWLFEYLQIKSCSITPLNHTENTRISKLSVHWLGQTNTLFVSLYLKPSYLI